MAYSTTIPPVQIVPRMGENHAAIWVYASADVDADVDAVGYFTNGDDLGMKLHDVVFIVDETTPLVTLAFVSAVTAGGAATVTFGAAATAA
jgi:lipid-binding SYLF domain-containing protein